LTLIGLVIVLVAATSACAPAATDAELNAMCENLIALRGEVDTKTLAERTAAVAEDFAKREKLHREQQEAALRGTDGALKGALEQAGDDEEAKKKVEAEHAENRKKLEQQGAELLTQLEAQKEEALAAAKQKAEEAQAEHAEAVKQCVEESKAEGVIQTLAQCR
jgi:hypothetical protein